MGQIRCGLSKSNAPEMAGHHQPQRRRPHLFSVAVLPLVTKGNKK